MKRVSKDQALALRVLIHELSHAKACEAASRIRATQAGTSSGRLAFLQVADDWAEKALTARCGLADLGIVLP